MDAAMISISRAAVMLGVDRRTVSDLARMLAIEPVPHPSNARGKAFTAAEVEHIRKALARVRKMAVA